MPWAQRVPTVLYAAEERHEGARDLVPHPASSVGWMFVWVAPKSLRGGH